MKGSSYLETSTKLQKHIATVLQLLDMQNLKPELITYHIGHTLDIHKTEYRQEASTVELMMVAKFFITKDSDVSFTCNKMKHTTGIRFLCIFVIILSFLFFHFDFLIFYFGCAMFLCI